MAFFCRSWLTWTALSVVCCACAESHGRSDADTDTDASGDAGTPTIDGSIAPPCDRPPMSCLHVERVLRAGTPTPTTRETFVHALLADDARLEVVHREYEEDVRFLSTRFDLSSSSALPTDVIDSLPFPNFGPAGALRSDGSPVYAWRALTFAGSGAVEAIETRWAMRVSGELGPQHVIQREPVTESPHQSLALVDVGGPLAIVLAEDARTLRIEDLQDGASWSLVLEASAWAEGGIRAAKIDDDRVTIGWHAIDPSGYATAMAVVFSRSAGPVSGPAPVLEMLSTPAELLHAGDSLWFAAFEELDDVAASRIRISRRGHDLRRLEPDRWVSGWGGIRPLGLQLVEWQDAPWAVWVTEDARSGPFPALFAVPLTGEACGLPDVPSTVVLATSVDWSRREWPDQMRATSYGSNMWVAVVAGREAGVDVHRVTSCR